MNIDDWIENKSFLVDSCMAETVIDVNDLRELLKTHSIVPKEPTAAMQVALSNAMNECEVYESLNGVTYRNNGTRDILLSVLKASQEDS